MNHVALAEYLVVASSLFPQDCLIFFTPQPRIHGLGTPGSKEMPAAWLLAFEDTKGTPSFTEYFN